MNAIALLFNLTQFQKDKGSFSTPDASQSQSTPIIYFLIALAVIVLGCLVLLFLLLLRRNKRTSHYGVTPQMLFASPPKIESERVPPYSGQSQGWPRSKLSQPQTTEYSQHTTAIFITYRREDSSDVTGRIYDRLCQHFGRKAVFKDVDSIPLGIDFRKHLGDSVGQCDVLLAVIGRQWLAGERGKRRLDDLRDFVRIEIESALKRNIPVVPVLVQGSSMPSLEDVPEILQSLVYRNGIPVRPDPDFHQDMDRLIKGIEGYLKKKSNS